ncbi:MAG: tetratricopeptide repeat protein [Myxococcota bacterium]
MARKRSGSQPRSSSIDGFEIALLGVVLVTVAGVAFLYRLDVNRIFDVPKATVLKIGGSSALLGWIALALFRGVRWDAARLFALPLTALVATVGVSTVLSLDPWTSFNGVYERQFGFQGYLACAGLFLATACCAHGVRGAVFCFGFLTFLGGVLGHYARLQGIGHDPFGFFSEPKTKVYSLLGNATFAGNALALIFPVCALLVVAGVVYHLSRPTVSEGSSKPSPMIGLLHLALGAIPIFLLQLSPLLFSQPPSWGLYTGCLLASGVFVTTCAGLGSWGPEGVRLARPSEQRQMDGLLIGALAACFVGIVLGLFHTRTRGAWVASLIALGAGAVLLPELFRQKRNLIRAVSWSTIGVLSLGLVTYIALSDSVVARTFRSIPKAFSLEKQRLGKGQGTRPYLWGESPRVLVDHHETLQRVKKDFADYAQKVEPSMLDLPFSQLEAETAPEPAWRVFAVWPFGIGVETYRYAFMSHKSKRLEALDPMTNHDNPHNNYLYLLASLGLVGLAAYLWLLVQLFIRAFTAFRDSSRGIYERMLSFGIVMSFFSYTVYSIAGFDSIACSVFLFFLLAAAANLYVRVPGPRRNLTLESKPRGTRTESTGPILNWPRPLTQTVALALAVLCLLTLSRAWTVYAADHAFGARPPDRRSALSFKIQQTQKAIRINPGESFYRQNLGSLLSRAAAIYRERAARTDDPAQRQKYLSYAEKTSEQAEVVLFSALHHSWAPENIFITAFQNYFREGRLEEAEWALQRALEHSPHLGAVRANLAQLQFQRGAFEEALTNCRWVLDVAPNSALGHQVCGLAALELDRVDAARSFLEKAIQLDPRDREVRSALDQLEALGPSVEGTELKPPAMP